MVSVETARRVAHLRDVDGLGFKAIAKRLGISVKTAQDGYRLITGKSPAKWQAGTKPSMIRSSKPSF